MSYYTVTQTHGRRPLYCVSLQSNKGKSIATIKTRNRIMAYLARVMAALLSTKDAPL